MSSDVAKQAAAKAASALIEDGALVGLGTGSTASLFISSLGARARDGLAIRCVASSEASAELARRESLTLIDLPAEGIDVAVDGADQVDHNLHLIKGGGGAHVHERIVISAATRFIAIVDESKVVATLTRALPVAILGFGSARTVECIEQFGGRVASRTMGGQVMVDDDGNILVDALFQDLADPQSVASWLDACPGVVGHGLFVKPPHTVLVGSDSGAVRELGVPQ